MHHLIFVSCLFLSAASAMYISSYQLEDCINSPYSSVSIPLDTCCCMIGVETACGPNRQRITTNGTNYTWRLYSDADCTTPSPFTEPTTGSAGTCINKRKITTEKVETLLSVACDANTCEILIPSPNDADTTSANVFVGLLAFVVVAMAQ